MFLILDTSITPGIRPLEFTGLEGRHFILLLIFLLIINMLTFAYRIYRTYLDSKKFNGIYEFISKQAEMNENWETYVKNLTERFIRESPPDQIRVVVGLLIHTTFETLKFRTKRLIELNGIHNRTATDGRIRMYIDNSYNSMRESLGLFLFGGRRLSVFMCKAWTVQVFNAVSDCVYGEKDIEALNRTLDDIAKQLKLEFFQRMAGNQGSNDEYDS
jgi:hypothetical protein